MLLKISFRSIDGTVFKIPIDYLEILQGFIYKNISSEFSSFLHDTGYFYEKRSFRLFTFSRLISRYYRDASKHTIAFQNPVHFYVATALPDLYQELGNTLLMKDDLWLGNQRIEITEVQVKKIPLPESDVVVRTVSPITMYSTFEKPNGRKMTVYYEPDDLDYNELITQNLIKKYKAFHDKDIEGFVKLEPLGKYRIHKAYYKGFPIKGAMGRFKISGSPELIKIGLETGFGSKNSQGWGCVLTERGEDRDD